MLDRNGAKRWSVTVGLLLTLGAPAGARASDPWETSGAGDDYFGSYNNLSHGTLQQHDLDEAGSGNDEDWMVVPTLAGHSYEARVGGTNVCSSIGECAPSVLSSSASTPPGPSSPRTSGW